MVPNVGSNRLSGTPTEGTWGHFAGLCGPYINTTTSVALLCVSVQTPQAQNTHGSAQKNKIISIWDRPRVRPQGARNDGVRWGARLTTVHRQFLGLGRSTAAQMPLVSCLSRYAISRSIR